MDPKIPKNTKDCRSTEKSNDLENKMRLRYIKLVGAPPGAEAGKADF